MTQWFLNIIRATEVICPFLKSETNILTQHFSLPAPRTSSFFQIIWKLTEKITRHFLFLNISQWDNSTFFLIVWKHTKGKWLLNETQSSEADNKFKSPGTNLLNSLTEKPRYPEAATQTPRGGAKINWTKTNLLAKGLLQLATKKMLSSFIFHLIFDIWYLILDIWYFDLIILVKSHVTVA